MPKRLLCVTASSFWVLLLIACQSGIPERVGNWRVEVGPPGNEFYQAPPESAEPAAPPSEEMFQTVRTIAPGHTEIRRWEFQRSGRYFIRAEAGPEEYDFLLSSDGKLIELEYEDDLANVDEQPGRLILAGARRNVPLSEVPEGTLKTLDTLYPGSSPGEAWHVDTPAGSRYVVVTEGLAFYARPDGQIQAFGLVERGALNEVEPESIKSPEEIAAEADRLLSPYRERFGLEKQLERLGKPSSDRYRFVVIGDSRSNPDLWVNIVKHIDLLDPKPQFVINTGDIVPHGYTGEYLEYYIRPLLETDIPFFVAIGNHDDGDEGMAVEFQALFGDGSLNYFFDYGNRRFILIDNVTSVMPYEDTLAWLERVLEETPADRSIIVAAHRPIATVEKWAYHSWDPENSRVFADLMQKYDVEHVFFGHIHAYSTARLDGIDYTITGGGGAGLHDRYGPMGNVHHYLVCDVEPDGTVTQQVVRFYPLGE